MKSATQILCCAVAAVLVPGKILAAAPTADLTNPIAQLSEVERAEIDLLFPSIVPGAHADGAVVASAYEAGKSCDACCGPHLGDGCCCGDSCCCGDGCDCGAGIFASAGDGPLWMASVGAVVLNRSQPVPSIIADPILDVAGIRATDFSIGTTVGVDLTIARRITTRGSLEARYLGALEWDPRAEFNGIGDMNLGGIDLAGITAIGGGYNSTLNSSEFNWRQQRSERFSWLVGFRWIELQDTIDFFVSTGGPSTSLSWNTNNHMYGGQIGADYLFWQSTARPLSVKGSGKFGVFGNDADNDFSQFIGPVQIVDGGDFGSETAFVTDLAVWVTYQLSDRWSVRGGGMFLYMDGVALGSDQISASLVQDTPNVLDTSGYVYYTGGLVSLDCVW